MNPGSNYLLLIADDATRCRWSSALRSTGAQVTTEPRSDSSDSWDVLVTDEPQAGKQWITEHTANHSRDVGILEIGEDGSADERDPFADSRLPANCSDREFVQTCRLIAEIVRLRRQQRRSDGERHTLRQLAFTDPLTGIANRRLWDEAFPDRVRAATAARHSLCLALFDLDLFKRVNERQGMAAGDEILRLAAQTLQSHLRLTDLLVRLGGDEFAMLLEVVEPTRAWDIVERIRTTLGAGLAAHEITASAGLVVLRHPNTRSARDLFQAADVALRRAKADGRNRTVAEAVGV